MKKIYIIFGLLSTLHAYANSGHRAGGDYFSHMPENSLVVLEESITGAEGGYALQYSDDFAYLEFDIFETKDHLPVVFHDKKIKRMIPYNEHNKAAYYAIREYRKLPKYKKLKIYDLTLKELQTFKLWGDYDQRVPSLQQFLDTAKNLGLIKPVIVELKHMRTDEGLEVMLSIVENYKNNYANQASIVFTSGFDFGEDVRVAFLGFKKNFKKSLGSSKNQKYWCKRIIEAGLHGVFRPRKHYINYCR